MDNAYLELVSAYKIQYHISTYYNWKYMSKVKIAIF